MTQPFLHRVNIRVVGRKMGIELHSIKNILIHSIPIVFTTNY
jgi:hypothetical protein